MDWMPHLAAAALVEKWKDGRFSIRGGVGFLCGPRCDAVRGSVPSVIQQ